MFNTTQQVEQKLIDERILPTTGLPTFRLLNIPRILRMSKDSFINNPNNDVDKYLRHLLKHVHEKDTKRQIQDVNELWKRYQKQMRGAVYELMQPKEKLDVIHTRKLLQKMIPRKWLSGSA